MSGLFGLLFLASLVGLFVGIANPNLFKKIFKHRTNRKTVTLSFALLLVAFSVLGAATSANPGSANVAQQKTSQTQTAKSPVITTKTTTTTQPIAFTTTTEQDSSLAQGKTAVKTAGVNGVETQTWKITYSNGVEKSKTLISTTTTTPAVTEVIEQGTYVAPTPTPAPTASSTSTDTSSCTNGTYVNSAGNTVCSPEASSTVPAGATAQCVDGTYSFSQSRSGTCSHHGGVATWL